MENLNKSTEVSNKKVIILCCNDHDLKINEKLSIHSDVKFIILGNFKILITF
jgi:hypothetical protein